MRQTFAAPIDCWSSGGLAQLGEHYVRNVGVGGSTPLPSTIRRAGKALSRELSRLAHGRPPFVLQIPGAANGAPSQVEGLLFPS
jgi:Mg-chelatase subunit ChlD